jgi:hypothetical protein
MQLFPTIKKVNVSKDEIVLVKLHEGNIIAGVIDDITKDHFILRTSPDPNSIKARFSLRIDQIVKLN